MYQPIEPIEAPHMDAWYAPDQLAMPAQVIGDVVIIDRTVPMRQVVGSVLNRLGYHIRATANGKEACRFIAAERPDLIIADMIVEDLTVAGLLKWLQAHPALSTIPVLIVSSLHFPPQARPQVHDNIAGYLEKPVPVGQVVKQVEAILLKVPRLPH